MYLRSQSDFACVTISGGDGYWNRIRGAIVRVESLIYIRRIGQTGDIAKYGELCAVFNTEDWAIARAGLLYTDRLWMECFKQALAEYAKFTPEELNLIDYSEQGMQGIDYVSMDVKDFDPAWAKIEKQSTYTLHEGLNEYPN